MKNLLLLKDTKNHLKKITFIFIIVVGFIFLPKNISYSEDTVFTINNIKVEGPINLNFNRDKYINKAFRESFYTLMKKILVTKDLEKVSGTQLKQVKNLILSFQILEESYRRDLYKANIKVFYDDYKVKNFLEEKNISFSQPENITALFFPILFVNDESVSLNKNFFYKNWEETKIQNELINYILPIEDLENISNISILKDKIEEANIERLVNKYDVENYVFVLMNYKKEKINMYVKTNFNESKTSKNLIYEIKNINDESLLTDILKSLKLKITDVWKEENLINLSMPLVVNLKYQHKNLQDLEKLKDVFDKIRIIDKSILEEFNINNSFFKIYYYGSPKKLKLDLSKLGYELNGDQGFWELYLNE